MHRDLAGDMAMALIVLNAKLELSGPNGKRTAFFMNGEEILIRGVGDVVAGSYKLVSIGLTSAVVEDTQSKRQQTVPLAEEAQV